MHVQQRTLSDGSARRRVRWLKGGGRHQARTFDRRRDATNTAADAKRHQQLGAATDRQDGDSEAHTP
jgi:hypothetical protein